MIIHPFKAVPVKVLLEKGRLLAIKTVEVLDPRLQTTVKRILKNMPFQASLVIPFGPLPEFVSHKEKLFAGVTVHISEEGPQVRITLPFVSGHFADEGPFPMDDLIVRNGQDKIFEEGVPNAEGELVMMELPKNGVLGDVFQRVVHPAHIPFHAKAQSPRIDRPRDHRPGCRFLGDHLDIREFFIDCLIHFS